MATPRAPQIYDCPDSSAPGPFEPSTLCYFVRVSGAGSGFSRLAGAESAFDRDILDQHFEMGQRSLWIMRRELLRVPGAVHEGARTMPLGLDPYGGVGPTAARRTFSDTIGRRYLYGDDGSELEYHYDRQGSWVLGFETLDEARESMGHPDLANAKRIVIATLLDVHDWH